MSGLPSKNNPYGAYPDIHMNTAKGYTASSPDIRMATAKGMTLSNDITMNTARVDTTLKQGRFQPWEQELLDSPEVRRKSTVAQLCKWLVDEAIFKFIQPLQISSITTFNY